MEKARQFLAKTTIQSIIAIMCLFFCFWNLSFNDKNIDDATKQFIYSTVGLILGFYFVNKYNSNKTTEE